MEFPLVQAYIYFLYILSRLGKPTNNAYIESFNSPFRQECLNQHWFLSFDDAKIKIEVCRRKYNSQRTHSALGNVTPEEFVSFQENNHQIMVVV